MGLVTKEIVILWGLVNHFIEDPREPGWIEVKDFTFGPRTEIDHSKAAGTVIYHPSGGKYLVNVVEITERS